jgi:hypothetical protein
MPATGLAIAFICAPVMRGNTNPFVVDSSSSKEPEPMVVGLFPILIWENNLPEKLNIVNRQKMRCFFILIGFSKIFNRSNEH